MVTFALMAPTAYLSIDMDFFNGLKPNKVFDVLDQLFWYVVYMTPLTLWNTKGPVIAVQNHQQLLQHANERPSGVLINVDQHSDMQESKTISELHCGNWVNFVKWRKNADYLWVRSREICWGNCNGCSNLVRWNSDHQWREAKTVRRSSNILDPLIKNYVLTGVGLCLSPDYVFSDLEPVFYKIVKKYQIPYKRGRRNEDFGRKTTLPKV
jgi:hypothetical protein